MGNYFGQRSKRTRAFLVYANPSGKSGPGHGSLGRGKRLDLHHAASSRLDRRNCFADQRWIRWELNQEGIVEFVPSKALISNSLR